MYKEQGINSQYLITSLCRKNPLSREEEKKLLSLIKKGDIEARNKLIEHNIRLVVSVLKNFTRAKLEHKDMFMEGVIGLVRATELYDDRLNSKFSSYACIAITRKIIQYIVKNRDLVISPMNGPALTHTIFVEDLKNSKNESIGFENSYLINTSYNKRNNTIDNKLISEDCLDKLAALDKKTIDMLKMFFGAGYERRYKLEEIANKHGYKSRQAARQAMLRGIKKIREKRGKDDSNDLRHVGGNYCMKLTNIAK